MIFFKTINTLEITPHDSKNLLIKIETPVINNHAMRFVRKAISGLKLKVS